MRRAAAAAAAAAAVAVGLVAVPIGAGSTAHATTKICVALVVDFRTLGGSVSTACATVESGSTGYDVLAAAGHRLGFRSDGIVCTIDGLPRDGCAATDGSHYWSYWHRPPGGSSWEYSDSGGGSYQPPNRSTDGWVWQNGGATGSTRPANVAYTSICRPSPSPSPSPSPAAVRRTTSRAAPAPVATSTTTAAARTLTAAAPPARTPSAAAPPSATATASAAGSPATGSAANGAAPHTPNPDVSMQARSHGGDGPPLAPFAGLAVVVGVAVAAGVRYRRGSGGAG